MINKSPGLVKRISAKARIVAAMAGGEKRFTLSLRPAESGCLRALNRPQVHWCNAA
jgi:hypothetical protein